MILRHRIARSIVSPGQPVVLFDAFVTIAAFRRGAIDRVFALFLLLGAFLNAHGRHPPRCWCCADVTIAARLIFLMAVVHRVFALPQFQVRQTAQSLEIQNMSSNHISEKEVKTGLKHIAHHIQAKLTDTEMTAKMAKRTVLKKVFMVGE